MYLVLGPIRVPTPGTPVRATVNLATPDLQRRFTCHAALFQALPSNSGKIYIGTASLVKATFAGVAAVLAVPTDNSLPTFSVALTPAPAGVDLADFWIDADTATEGVLLTVLVA